MRKIIIVFFFLAINNLPQTIDWIKLYSCTGLASTRGSFSDSVGNVYVIGNYIGTLTIDSTTYSSGISSSFIVKYNSFGLTEWIKTLGNPGNIILTGIAYDNNGSCYITGGLEGTVLFDSIQVSSASYRDPFITKMDLNGNFIWVSVAFGYGADDLSTSITVDSYGNQYITGFYYGWSMQFGTHFINSRGLSEIFVAKCDSTGNFLWANSFGASNGNDYGEAISSDDSGNVYVTGSFGGLAYFGSSIFQSFGYNDIFLTKLDYNGNLVWTKQFGSSSEDWSFHIIKLSDSSIVFTGYFSSGLNGAQFGNFVIYSNGSSDIFLSKINSLNGDVDWVEHIGGASSDRAKAIAVNLRNEIYLAGEFVNTITLNDTTIISQGDTDILICKYDQNGEFITSSSFGSTKNDGVFNISINNLDELYVCGGVDGDFNPYRSLKDGILIKMTDKVLPVELISFLANKNESNILLYWSTTTELNNNGFEIERSFDKTNWATIGFREGKGTTSEPQAYTYSDDISEISTSKLYYRLKQIDFNGSFEYSEIVEVEIAPTKFALEQNYPNPFNPSTSIQYAISSRQFVTLRVYDVLGKEIATLVNEEKSAGQYKVDFNPGSSIKIPASGIYFYQLKAGDYIETKKMILLK